jgi:N-acetylmuramoyl-L-alanine amidase
MTKAHKIYKQMVRDAISRAAAFLPYDLRGITPKRFDIDILLTNAHGGLDPDTGEYVTPGKRSPIWDKTYPPVSMENIYYEGVAMRLINAKIKGFLRALGVNCIIVNDTFKDTPISAKRAQIKKLIDTGKISPEKAFGYEIHSNATAGLTGLAHGSEFYSYPGQSKTDLIQTIVGEEYKKEFPGDRLRSDFRDGDLDKEAKFGILKIDPLYGIPWGLGETFFHDNLKECKEYLMQTTGRIRIAKFYTKAFIRTINELY